MFPCETLDVIAPSCWYLIRWGKLGNLFSQAVKVLRQLTCTSGIKAVYNRIQIYSENLDWRLEPGYDPDRNLLSMCSRTVLVWVVDFVMAVGLLKPFVCFDCVSIACQQWWWGLGQAGFFFFSAATNNFSSRSSAVAVYSGLRSISAVPVVALGRDPRSCMQTDECVQTKSILQSQE